MSSSRAAAGFLTHLLRAVGLVAALGMLVAAALIPLPADAETPPPGPCEPGYVAPTPASVAVTEVPIEVTSTTDDYFVLYAKHTLNGETTDIPVSVTLGEDGTTTLSDNLEPLAVNQYRVEKYQVAKPADVDGDCVDDITELGDFGAYNPINSAEKINPINGAVAIDSHSAFQELAFQGTSHESHLDGIAFVKFWIFDPYSDSPEVFFMNTKRFVYHNSFLRAIGYTKDTTGAMAGQLVWHPNVPAPDGTLGSYRFEWGAYAARSFEGTERVYMLLAAAMPFLEDNLYFYPETTRFFSSYWDEREKFDGSRIRILLEHQVLADVDYIALNPAEGYGRLRLMEDDDRPSPFDVAIYTSLPNDLPRVAGTITTVPQTPLSHVNLRAIQNGLPNAFIRDALEVDAISSLLDSYVYYAVTADGYTIRAATKKEVDDHHASLRPQSAQTLQSDLTAKTIVSLANVDFDDWTSYGVKAANVAELASLSLPEGTTPVGFAVPFYFYDEFMKQATVSEKTLLGKKKWPDDEKIELAAGTTLASAVTQVLAHTKFQTDYDVQEEMLDDLRDAIKDATTPKFIIDALTAMHAKYPDGQSLRYRSSTNNEDLPSFNGAGLYSSKTQDPDETADDGIDKSIKAVWASLWNYRAFLERDFHRVDHSTVYMGVLVHPNYSDETVNGVAVSYDPVTFQDNAYFVNSQVGEDLVTNPEAYSQPEQLLLGATGTATVLSRSNLVTSDQLLMSDAQMRQLRSNLETIHNHFKTLYGVQDGDDYAIEIEFKITAANKLAIKQARPWIFAEPLVIPNPTVSLAIADDEITEGTGLQLMVTRSGGILSSPLRVGLAWSETGAMLTSEPSSVTIPGNQTSATVTVPTQSDSQDEHDSVVSVSIVDNSGYVIGTPGSATATVTDDDLTQVAVRAQAGTVTEGSPAVFTFTRSGTVLENPLTVQISVSETGSRLAGTSPTEVVFAANSATASVSLTSTDDSVRTPESTVVVQISSSSQYGIDTGIARLKIEDDELPGPSIRTPLDHVVEHNQVNVVVLNASKRDVSYAIAGPDTDDFTLYSEVGLLILESRSFANPVDANRDGVYEIDLTASATNTVPTTVRMRFVVSHDAFLSVTEQSWDQLSLNDRTALLPDIATSHLNRAFANLEDHIQAAVAILSRQGQIPAPGPTISVSNSSDVTEGNNAAFTVTANPAPAADLDVAVSIAQTGDFGVDTTARTVTIPSSGTQTLTLATADDEIDENNGSVTATVDRGSGYLVSHAGGQATIGINDDDDPPAVTPEVSIAAGAGVTEGGDATFTVTASPAPSSALTVAVAVAQSGDFGVAMGSNTVVIPTTGSYTLTVATVNDSVDEADGSVTATLSDGQGYTVSASANTATVAVSDDDVPEVSIAAGSGIIEGGGAVFTITADPAPASTLTVDVTVTQTGDYGLNTGPRQVTIPTSGTATLNLSTTNDSLDEADGSVTAAISAGTGYTVSSTAGSAAVAVSDDDDPPVIPEVSITAGTGVTEGTDATFTLTATPAPTAALSVSVAVTQTGDYAAPGSRTVTIPTSGSATLALSTTNDSADEPDGSVTATVSAGSGYTVSSTAGSATVAVADDDDPPVVTPEVSIAAGGGVTEGGDARFMITADPAPSAALTVTVSVSQTGDYGITGGSRQVTIPASGTATLTVATVNDSADEADGSVTATVRVGSGYTVSSSAGSATVAVADDDPAPPADPCVAALSGDGSVSGVWAAGCGSSARSGRFARFYSFSLDSPGRVTIDLESTADTYLYLRRGVGQRSGAALASNDDSGGSYNSRISRQLAAGGYTIEATTYRASTAGSFTLTVDGIGAQTVVQPMPEVSVAAGADVDEGGDATFTVSAVPAPSAALDVTVAVTATGDFGVSPGSHTVTVPTTGTATLTIATAGDSADEADGTVTATLSSGSGYTVSATASSAVVAVADDDAAVCVPSLPSDAVTVSVVTGWRDQYSHAEHQQRWDRVLAALGVDTGETAMTVADAQAVKAQFDNSRWDRTVRTLQAMAQCDSDPPPAADPEVSITAGAGVTEGGDATFTITADPAPLAALTVEVTVAQSGDFGVSPGSRSVTVPTSGSVTLTVATADDSADEADGSVTVTVDTGSGYTVSQSAGTATVAVADDDDPPAVTPEVSITAGGNITEGGDATFTITADPAPAAALTVDVTVAQSGDYGATTGTRQVTVTTSGSVTFTVATTNDSADETDGTVTATVDGGNGYTVSATAGTATVAVADDDDPAPPASKPSITVGDATAGEGDGAVEFTVELSAASAGTVTVYYSIWGGTATAYDDYLPAWGSVVFAPGETSKTVPVSLVDDRASGEGAETFTLRLRLFDTTHATLTDTSAQGTITDND